MNSRIPETTWNVEFIYLLLMSLEKDVKDRVLTYPASAMVRLYTTFKKDVK